LNTDEAIAALGLTGNEVNLLGTDLKFFVMLELITIFNVCTHLKAGKPRDWEGFNRGGRLYAEMSLRV
jgi:hypothetical protein